MHECRIRVRFDEVDTMGIVHHPRYLVYFEIARTEWLRDHSLSYREIMAGGTHLAVVETGVRHLRPAKYDDEIVVRTRCAEVGGASVRLEYEVMRGADRLATGFTRLGAVDAEGRPRRLPADLRARFAEVVVTPADSGAPSGAPSEGVQATRPPVVS
jgi:acyl-CoA thioester hydrolase